MIRRPSKLTQRWRQAAALVAEVNQAATAETDIVRMAVAQENVDDSNIASLFDDELFVEDDDVDVPATSDEKVQVSESSY
jgi:hypothetical protein